LKGKRGNVKRSHGYVEEFLNEFDRNPISKENVAVRYNYLKFGRNTVKLRMNYKDSGLETHYQE
jgi:hypothetical protein